MKKTLLHIAILTAAVAAGLFVFIDKAVHMDDTLFIWTARQILERPWDFYGFSANWDGKTALAVEIIKNPPLAAYYLAAAGYFYGFTERALHAAFIIPAVFAVLGTYALARRFTSMPFLAALAAFATPAFLVSSTTLMCDVMMLAFWVWAVFLWVKGVDEGKGAYLIAAAVFVILASLTKYFGMSLIPLLAAWSVFRGKKGLGSLAFLLIPIAALGAYQLYTGYMYGAGLLLDASSYAARIGSEGTADIFEKAFMGLAFTGGVVIIALFFLPSIWGLWAIIPGVMVTSVAAYFAYELGVLGSVRLFDPGFGWGYIAELSLLAAAGAGIIFLVVYDIVKNREAESLLLALWVLGTLAFTVHFNWTINARSILPMAPAVAMLIARAAGSAGTTTLVIPLALSFGVSFLVAWGDMNLANSARDAAGYISGKYSGQGRLWFQGHWGFQYYMEAAGAKAIDWKESRVMPGDAIAFPFNNTGLRLMNEESVILAEELKYTPDALLSTMTLGPGAGFYASEWGPMPFMLFPPNEERYWVVYAKNAGQ